MKFTFTREGGGRADRAASTKGLFLGSVAAVCLLAMLGLVSCGDGDGGSTQARAQMPMNMMKGYFLTQNEGGEIQCLSEDLVLNENANGTVDSDSEFEGYNLNQRGYRAPNVEDGEAGTEILALAYSVVNSDGTNRRNPGIYYFQKINDDPVRFGGLWIGKPNLPNAGTEGMVCPYIMVPDSDGMATDACPSDIVEDLGTICYRTNAMGFVDGSMPVRSDGQ